VAVRSKLARSPFRQSCHVSNFKATETQWIFGQARFAACRVESTLGAAAGSLPFKFCAEASASRSTKRLSFLRSHAHPRGLCWFARVGVGVDPKWPQACFGLCGFE